MKIPFDIKYKQDILDGKVKVVTRNNEPVRILAWDMKVSDRNDVVALVTCSTGNEHCRLYYSDGKPVSTGSHSLFILTPDPEPTEFEKCFIREIEEVHGAVVPVDMEAVKESCGKLLELAKKEIAVHYKVSSNYDGFAYAMGREEALKGLPKWMKCENKIADNYASDNGWLYKTHYKIKMEELWNKLPKEK